MRAMSVDGSGVSGRPHRSVPALAEIGHRMTKMRKKAIWMLAILAVVVSLSAALVVTWRCPVCGGWLVSAAKLSDDTTRPSRNLCVWNRSICANLFYGPGSVICTRCWYAHSPRSRRWERSIAYSDGFYHPLRPEIRGVPVPGGDRLRGLAVFSQVYAHGAFTDSVAFWCIDNAGYITGLRHYCTTNHLTLTDERAASMPGDVYIKIQ